MLWISGSGEKRSSSEVGQLHSFFCLFVFGLFICLFAFKLLYLQRRSCRYLKAFRKPTAQHLKGLGVLKATCSQPGLCVTPSSAVWYFCPSTFLQCQEPCTGRVLLPKCLFQQHETDVCHCETVIAPQPFRCLLSAPWDLVSTASYSLSFHTSYSPSISSLNLIQYLTS